MLPATLRWRRACCGAGYESWPRCPLLLVPVMGRCGLFWPRSQCWRKSLRATPDPSADAEQCLERTAATAGRPLERSVIADNSPDRDFQADRPNQKWRADFACIWTAEGWLCVAVVRDIFSRPAVGGHEGRPRCYTGRGCLDDVALATRKGLCAARSFGPRRNGQASNFNACWPTTPAPAQ